MNVEIIKGMIQRRIDSHREDETLIKADREIDKLIEEN